ncbi:MAG: GNAT family N-acetyltransferase [Bacteroidetes bacterium]|nr:GNAT family N-acetyltransferase [Bacteroidota bacterium]
MMEIKLFDDYVLREVSPQEFGPFFREQRPRLFAEGVHIHVEEWMTEDEKNLLKDLAERIKDAYLLRAFIMKGDTIVGWHMGRQTDMDTYYMANTAVLPEYRGRGIYSEMVVAVIEYLRGKGFQKLTSRHLASNNLILTLKLRAGFQITGMEVDERFGILVCLSYLYNEKRRDAYRFRIGTKRPDDELKKFL